MSSMGADHVLKFLASKGLEVANDIHREIRDLRARAAVGVALETAKQHNKINEGRRTWQTLLAAAAFHRPANDDEEEKEEEDGPTSMSVKRKAAALGVTEQA